MDVNKERILWIAMTLHIKKGLKIWKWAFLFFKCMLRCKAKVQFNLELKKKEWINEDKGWEGDSFNYDYLLA